MKWGFVFLPIFAFAEVIDLGTHGPTFKVEEENMILHIKQKLLKLEKDGELESLKDQWKERIKSKFKRPAPVQGITKTKEARSWRHDPTLVMGNDIKTPGGDILAKKGDKINPLHTVKPQKGFLFIDGEDKEQVEFAKKHLNKFDLVLIKGSPFDTQEQIQAETFFDQGGLLTSHYGVTQVPAFLSVQGDHLLIEEVICEKP